MSEVRERHRRKSGFMPEFERIAVESERIEGPTEPGFSERVKAQWGTA